MDQAPDPKTKVRVVVPDLAHHGDMVTTQYDKMSDVSDGYHTFSELYRFRMILQAAWFNQLYSLYVDHDMQFGPPVKSKKHQDGAPCFDGEYFVVVLELPTGQISNHYKLEHWDLFKIPELPTAPVWDGHTPAQAAERIEAYLANTGVK